MTKTEIYNGNILIAEFMGERQPLTEQFNFFINIPGKTLKRWINVTDLKYHCSWDWLMPVIIKTNLIFEKGIKKPGRQSWDEIYDMLVKINIERTWFAVVQFIQWYNKHLIGTTP